MKESTSYLKNLKFDPELANSFFAKYLRNVRLVVLIILLTIIVGIVSYTSLPRVLNPQINIPIVNIVTTLPGASPDDIETLITVPIEDSVDGLNNVKTITSSSQDSVSIVTLEFESGIDPDKAKADVQSEIDSITDLPENAQSPNVQKLDFENEPIWTFTVTSTKNDPQSLVRFSRNLRDQLEDLSTVDRAEVNGIDNEEIQIIIDPQLATTYGLAVTDISQAITSALGSYPGGTITTDSSTFVVTIDPTVATISDLRNVVIETNGSFVTLGQVAKIQQRNDPSTKTSYLASQSIDAVETIRFDVYKTSSANVTDAVDDTQEKITELENEYEGAFTVHSVLNSGEEIDTQFKDLVRDFSITVSLVFIALLLFLGLRQAIVASLAIPLTFLVTFIVMNATGVSLSFIAFFSFLLSLGLLVDDTIVIISAVSAYYKTGKFSPYEAGLLVWRDFKTPILTTTLTTVWAFVPLLLSTGIIGEFIKPIPIVVTSALVSSFAIALLITLPVIIILLTGKIAFRVVVLLRILGVALIVILFSVLMPTGTDFIPALGLFVLNILIFFGIRYFYYQRKQTASPISDVSGKRKWSQNIDQGFIDFTSVEKGYRRLITKILAKRFNRRIAITTVIIFSLFSYLLLPFGFVKNEFFPKSDVSSLYLSLEMPAGTNAQTTQEEMLRILKDLRKTNDVSFITATPGLSIDPGRGFAGAGDNVALFSLVLPEPSERDRTSIEIADALREEYKTYSKATLSIVELSEGPPAGSDLQIKISGEDLTELDSYADQIKTYLESKDGISNVNKSIKPGTSKIVFVPNYQELARNNVSQQQVGLALRNYANGFTVDEDVQLQNDSDLRQDIIIRASEEKQSVQELGTITIQTRDGIVPLSSLGTFELRPNPTLISREEGKRTISVSASVTGGQAITDVNTDLEAYADSLNLPNGYSWSTGGVNEENQNSVNAILLAMLLSFFLIIVTMVLQFSSFRKALIVMLVIPLSISGVFILFSLTGTPLSFPALIGVLALFGIVVKNSILVVDKINQNIQHNLPYREAIVDAAESRLEPITLTTIATILGLIPITLSDPLWQGLGGAIISGLVFSGTVMLFFIPVVYYVIFHTSEGKGEKDQA